MSPVSVTSGQHRYSLASPPESPRPKLKQTRKSGEKGVGWSQTSPRSYIPPLKKGTEKLASSPPKSRSAERFTAYSKGGEREKIWSKGRSCKAHFWTTRSCIFWTSNSPFSLYENCLFRRSALYHIILHLTRFTLPYNFIRDLPKYLTNKRPRTNPSSFLEVQLTIRDGNGT